MTEARKTSARILVKRPRRDVNFIVSHFANEVSLLNVAAKFASRSPVQKADFPVGIIKKIALLQIHNLFG